MKRWTWIFWSMQQRIQVAIGAPLATGLKRCRTAIRLVRSSWELSLQMSDLVFLNDRCAWEFWQLLPATAVTSSRNTPCAMCSHCPATASGHQSWKMSPNNTQHIKYTHFTSAVAQCGNRIADICIVLLQQCGLTPVFSFGLRQGSKATSVKRYRMFHCVGDLWWKCHSAQNPKSWLGQGSTVSSAEQCWK